MLLGHGDNAYQFNHKIIADFSTNVFYGGTDKHLIQFLQNKLADIDHYPEVKAESLADKIAEHYLLKPENILVTNGATEAFYLLAHLFQNNSSEIIVPSFAEYKDACQLYNHHMTFTNHADFDNNYQCQSDLIWLCNPNNPDGKLMSKDDLKHLIKRNPQTLFIIDEAYKDFTLENQSLVNEINAYNNLVLVHSMTKKHAIPGLRLGYIVTNQPLIEELTAYKQPWTVNRLAIEAGKWLLSQPHQTFDINQLIHDSQNLQQQLSKINGIEVFPSSTPYFLIKTSKTSQETSNYLIENFGVLLRNASNFKGLDQHYLRISSRYKSDNALLVKALQQWMQIP